jgi:hypothetical protein
MTVPLKDIHLYQLVIRLALPIFSPAELVPTPLRMPGNQPADGGKFFGVDPTPLDGRFRSLSPRTRRDGVPPFLPFQPRRIGLSFAIMASRLLHLDAGSLHEPVQRVEVDVGQ